MSAVTKIDMAGLHDVVMKLHAEGHTREKIVDILYKKHNLKIGTSTLTRYITTQQAVTKATLSQKLQVVQAEVVQTIDKISMLNKAALKIEELFYSAIEDKEITLARALHDSLIKNLQATHIIEQGGKANVNFNNISFNLDAKPKAMRIANDLSRALAEHEQH